DRRQARSAYRRRRTVRGSPDRAGRGRSGGRRRCVARGRAGRADGLHAAARAVRDAGRLPHGRTRSYPQRRRDAARTRLGVHRHRGRQAADRTGPRRAYGDGRVIEFLVVLLLLVGNAFFVAGEFSLISARRTVLEPMASTSRRAQLALRAMSEIPLLIAGAQL